MSEKFLLCFDLKKIVLANKISNFKLFDFWVTEFLKRGNFILIKKSFEHHLDYFGPESKFKNFQAQIFYQNIIKTTLNQFKDGQLIRIKKLNHHLNAIETIKQFLKSSLVILESRSLKSAINNIKQALKLNNPFVIAHRGGSINHLENTQEAFDATYKLHSKINSLNSDLWFETDVRLTKDRQLLIYHDKTFVRLANNPAKVSDLTLSQIKKINHSKFHLITFQDLITRYPKIQRLYVDIKDKGLKGQIAILELLKIAIAQKVTNKLVITTAIQKTARKVKKILKILKIEIATSANEVEASDICKKALFGFKNCYQNNLSDTLDLPWIDNSKKFKIVLFRKKIIRTAQKFGYQLSFWDSNLKSATHKDVVKAVKWKVFGLIINDTNLAIQVFENLI